MIRTITTITAALMSGTAYAGGYVAPIFAAPPVVATPVAVAAEPNSWWLAIPLLALLALSSRGGNSKPGLTPLPGDYGGPCFREGTLVLTTAGWAPIEILTQADVVVTSRGPQRVLAVDSWTPKDHRHRPVVVEGVHMTANHRIRADEGMIEAEKAGHPRAPIDGMRYYHVVIEDHAMLTVASPELGLPIHAESMQVSPGTKMGREFPHLIERHAKAPAAELVVEA